MKLDNLGKHIDILSGFAFKSKDFKDHGQLPVIRIRDVKRGYSKTFYSGDYDKKYLVKDGDLLVGMDGEFNAGVWQGGNALLNQRVCKIIPLESVNFNYLKFFLPVKLKKIEQKTSFVTVKHLSVKDIKTISIPLPPIAEQKRIAAILDKSDRIRRKRQEAIQLTEELARSLFLDMFGDPVTNPKGWEIQKLRNVIQSINAGWSANGEERKCEADEWGVLKVSAVTSGKFKPLEHKAIGKNPQFKKEPVIPRKGDLLFSRANTRELVAATCIVEKNYDRIFLSDKLWRISTFQNLITPEYLKFLLTYQRYRDLLTRQATGTSGSMLNISQNKLLNMNAPIPNIDIQKKFSDLIWKSIKMSMLIQESFEESENLFNSLLQRAFRGEL